LFTNYTNLRDKSNNWKIIFKKKAMKKAKASTFAKATVDKEG
jgi:hypothetical protein